MCDELNLIDIIDTELNNNHFNRKISSGQASVAIILNLLNVLQKPLMLSDEFMEIRPLDRLINRSDQIAILSENEITAEHFNQHVLGRTLDKLYDHGLEELFMTIASATFRKFNRFGSKFYHADTTSMSVHGKYEKGSDDGLIKLTYGHSKAHRPDLKQFVISMICCNRIPIFLSTLSGNTSDKAHFQELIKQYGQQVKAEFGQDKVFVLDSAFYNGPRNGQSCRPPAQ